MPKAADEKTKSEPKRILWPAFKKPLQIFYAALITLALIAVVLLVIISFRGRYTKLRVDGHTYKLQIAKTTAALQKGLGDRNFLPVDQGMLFEFSGDATRCFWMKDMRFSLDMVWLNSFKQVVAIRPDVSPATYPEVFCPKTPAQYVIELSAGQAAAADIRPGEQLKF